MKELSSLPRATTEISQQSQGPDALSPAPIGWWQRFCARWRTSIEIPYGYEDEDGFHYGREPKPQQATASATTAESRRVFTDRACDAIQYASALAPKPEAAPAEKSQVQV